MKKFLAILLVLTMVFALVACSSSDEDESEEAESETVVEEEVEDTEPVEDVETAGNTVGDASLETADSTSGKTLDCLRIGTQNSTVFCGAFDNGIWSNVSVGYGTKYLVYDSLFHMNSTGEFVSRIIESYEFPDANTMVIQLKPDIYFSNGVQLTGRDILYSLELAQQIPQRSTYYTPFIVDESYYSDDGLTVTLAMEFPYGAYYCGLDFAIFCAEYCEGNEEDIDWYDPDQVVGSGPYTCTELTTSVSATYVKRDDYWGLAYGYDSPYETIECTNYMDQSTLCIELESGGIDVAFDISLNDYERLDGDDTDAIATGLVRGNVPYILVFDINNNEYLADIRVREAICKAVDMEALTESAGGSFGIVADSVLGENELGYVGGLGYEYDPEGAKQILENAGYADGEITLTLRVIGSEPYTSIAEILNYYLDQIGITVDIYSEEMMTFVSNIGEVGYSDMQIYTMADGNPNGDPFVHMEYWYSDSAYPIMRRDYDELLDLAGKSMDEEVRAQYYGELCQLWHDNYDCLPLYDACTAYAYSTDVFEDFEVASMMCIWVLDATVK